MARPRRLRHVRRAAAWRLVVGVAVLAAVTSGCMMGQRPSFDDDQPAREATGDPAIDAVLDRLDRVRVEYFTADYSILTRLCVVLSTARVVQADNSRRSITINDIRFLDGTGTVATCNLATDECEATLNDARVSNLQVTHEFYATSAAQRLRVDAQRKLGDARGYEMEIAGLVATCADVPVSGGTKAYCAVEAGALARYDGNDLRIELTSFDVQPDESAFAS